MELNDIIALAKAGFTADQITALQAAPAPAPAPAPEVPVAPAPAPAPEAPAAPSPDMSAVLQKMDALMAAMQVNQMFSTQQPQAETVDDILANIIAPKPPVKK